MLSNVVKQTDRKKPAVDNLMTFSLIKINIKTAKQVMQVHETETKNREINVLKGHSY